MALGVVGDVDHRSADGGGELLAADAAEGFQVGRGEGADALRCVREGDFKLGDELGERLAALLLGPVLLSLERGELLGGELAALGIGEQAVGGAGDVAQVEGDGGQAEGLGVDFSAGEAGGPAGDVVESVGWTGFFMVSIAASMTW